MSLHLQAVFTMDSGDSKDIAVNTWNIATQAGVEPTQAQAIAACEALFTFYRTTPAGQAKAVGGYYSDFIKDASGGLVIKAYNSTGKLGPPAGDPPRLPAMGSPLATDVGTFTLGNGTPLPSHLAAVLTLEGADWDDQPVEVAGDPPTRPRARRRGRVYLGPLNTTALAGAGEVDASIAPAFQSTVFAAIAKLRDDIAAINAVWKLGVWSRSNGAIYAVESVSMDDRLDVVQARKRHLSTRTRVNL